MATVSVWSPALGFAPSTLILHNNILSPYFYFQESLVSRTVINFQPSQSDLIFQIDSAAPCLTLGILIIIMSRSPQLGELSNELLLHLASFLDCRDLSVLSRLKRHLYWLLFEPLFDQALSSYTEDLEDELIDLFFHACKTDSKTLAQYLIFSNKGVDLHKYGQYFFRTRVTN